MTGIMPDESVGGVIVRTETGACTGLGTNAYCPGAGFASTCALTALPDDCSARVTPAQMNAIVSELIALGETFDPDGTWRCNATNNLAGLFNNWALNVASGAEALAVAQQALNTANEAEAKIDQAIEDSASDRAAAEAAAEQTAEDLAEMEVLVSGLTGTVTTIEQADDGTWPARPSGYESVHFFGDTFPTGLMTSRRDSFWLRRKKERPSPPGDGDWKPVNMHDGVNAGIIIYTNPDSYPPITGIEYSIDGGSYLPLSGTAPGLYPVPAGGTGNKSFTLRWVNAAGTSSPSTAQTVAINANSFIDTFDRVNQDLSDSENWTDVSISNNSTRLSIVSNEVRPGTTNAINSAIAEQYFMPNMRVEAPVMAAGNNTADPRGVTLIARARRLVEGTVEGGTTAIAGYTITVTNANWRLYRITTAGVRTQLISGSRVWTAGNILALEVKTNASGNVEIKLFDNGTQFGTTFTDSSADKILTGNQAAIMMNAAGSEGAGATRIAQIEIKAAA